MIVKNRQAARKWLNGITWQIAGTITFDDKTNDEARRRIMKIFKGRINRLIYNNAIKKKRGNKRIEILIISENNCIDTNLHYHLAINMPKDLGDDCDLFCKFLVAVWKEHCGTSFMCKFKTIYDSKGWIDYITKGIKGNNCDGIELYSSQLARLNS